MKIGFVFFGLVVNCNQVSYYLYRQPPKKGKAFIVLVCIHYQQLYPGSVSNLETFKSAMLPIVFTFILLIGESAYGYPSGAPEETCSSLSPEHGHGVPSQPVAQAPFYVVAHGKKFSPGDKIGGKKVLN